MDRTRNLLRKSVKALIREAIIREVFIKRVANKAASGEKYDPTDMIGLFQMTFDTYTDPSAADASTVAWQALMDGLSDERSRQLARETRQAIQQLAKQKTKLEKEMDNLGVGDPSYDDYEDELNAIAQKQDDLSDKLKVVARKLSDKHQPNSSKEPSSDVRDQNRGSNIKPSDTPTFVGLKNRN